MWTAGSGCSVILINAGEVIKLGLVGPIQADLNGLNFSEHIPIWDHNTRSPNIQFPTASLTITVETRHTLQLTPTLQKLRNYAPRPHRRCGSIPTSVVSEATKHSRQPTGNVSFEAIRGLSITPRILRHTYISNLLLGGVDIKTVQYLAGHERATITLDIYAHLTYNRPEEILPKVNSAFSNE